MFAASLKKFFFASLAFLLLLFTNLLNAAYVFQTVSGEAFDSVTTNVVWTNDASQTDFPIDDDYQLVNIGFTFYLGETAYTQVRILSNGALHFGADQGFHKDYTNEALPITSFIGGPGFEEAADRAVLGYWDDLEPLQGGTVRYGTLGSAPDRRFVASWENVPRYNGPGTSYSFQIVLYENGQVRFRYGNDNANGSSATIGIEVDDSDFTQFSFNSNSVSDSNDILWTREFPTIVSAVANCGSNIVTVTFDSAVSPVRAADTSNFSIDNGVSIVSSNLINPTTVELTTSGLSPSLSYTLSTTSPTQNVSFSQGGLTTINFTDDFSSGGYSGGSTNWSSNWIEIADDGSPSGGNVTIVGGELWMDDQPNSGGEPSIYREMDLTGFTSATFSFDYNTPGTLENSDRFDILVSANGGASYTVIDTFSNDVSGSASYDISAFISSNTRIRFTIENNFGGGSERMEIDNVSVSGTASQPCTSSVDHFVITHDGNGINCLREAISITAADASGGTVADYTGTVNLSLITNNGNWFTLDSGGSSSDLAQGTLTDTAGDNDGNASYQFDANDLGNVTLYLQNTQAETTNISIAEGAITDDNSEGDISFRPFGFVFSPSPISTQIAGRAFNITLTAAGQTPTQPECGVIEEYTGNQNINFWSSYSSPTSSPTLVSVNGTNIATSEAASTSQSITFNSGVAVIAANYNDVGQISISAKDETGIGDPASGNVDEIIGGISPFVVRPFAFDMQIASNPYADDANDPVFTQAGNNFSMTIRSVIWQAADDLDNDGVADPFIDTDADGIPDSGGDLSDNIATANISQISGSIALTPTALVVTNSNGSLTTTSIDFSSFPVNSSPLAGSFSFTQSWSEVGILQLDALTSSFMSSGENVIGQRINIGRFVADHLTLSITAITAQCGSFTYAGFFDGVNPGLDKDGQFFTIAGNITAENSSNVTTQNYAGGFAKLLNTDLSIQAFNIDTASNATGNINFSPAALNFVNGSSSYADNNSHYQFDAFNQAFNLRADINATDSDGVSSGTVSSNSFEVRLGRLRLVDAFGPETNDLEVRLIADYYAATGWVTNSGDNCSSYIQTNSSFDAASYTDNLNPGETSIFSPASAQTLVNGLSRIGNGLLFSAPGSNNYGSVQINFDLSAQPWLGFDWDLDNNLDNPTALLSFGYYRGSDRVIFWREVKN